MTSAMAMRSVTAVLVLSSSIVMAATPPAVIDPRNDVFSQGAAGMGAPEVPARRAPGGNPLWAIPLRQLSATRDRPLFAPSRRPPPPVVANFQQIAPAPPPPPKSAEPAKLQLSLVGTVAGESEGIGVFLDQAAKTVLRLRIGERHRGWVLRAVYRREVVLETETESTVLALPSPDMKTTAAPPNFAPPANLAPPLGAQQGAMTGTTPLPPTGSPQARDVPVTFNPFPLPAGVRPSTEPTTFNPFKTPARAP